jgi:hypothetical protein
MSNTPSLSMRVSYYYLAKVNPIDRSPSNSGDEVYDELWQEDLEHLYDSDFSEASTPPMSDSDSDSNISPDPELLALIPRCLWDPPELPIAGFVWTCPVPDCEYSIDFLKLTAENVAGLLDNEVRFLKNKKWTSIQDGRVTRNFYLMVTVHWDDHLERNGIQLRKSSERKVLLIFLMFLSDITTILHSTN